MPEEFWYTVLGGFLSGAIGVLLFFIQRCVEKKDEKQNTLFNIARLMQVPIGAVPGGPMQRYAEETKKSMEIAALAFQLKDKELAKKIYVYATAPGEPANKDSIFREILSRINKNMFHDLIQKSNSGKRKAKQNN